MTEDPSDWEETIDPRPHGDCDVGDSDVVNIDALEQTEDESHQALDQTADVEHGNKESLIDKPSTEDSAENLSGCIADMVSECPSTIAVVENDSQGTNGSVLPKNDSSNDRFSLDARFDERTEAMRLDDQQDTSNHDVEPSGDTGSPPSYSQTQNTIVDTFEVKDSHRAQNKQESPSETREEGMRELICENDTCHSDAEKLRSEPPKTREEKKGSSEMNEQKSSSDPNSERSTGPAGIPLPGSPYFNPFDSPTEGERGSRRGSTDGIPSLDDTLPGELFANSPMKQVWELRKRKLDQANETMDKVMDMVGIDHIKAAFLDIKGMIDTARSRREHLRKHDLNFVLTGNPGTEPPEYKSLSGRNLNTASNLQTFVDSISDGVLSLYDAGSVDYNVFAFLIDALNNRPGVILIMSGSADNIPPLLGSSPNGRWLFPQRLHIEDYNDEELGNIFLQMVRQDNFKIEGGPTGPYPRILARRVGYGRDEPGFGNAHELRLSYLKILERQASRLLKKLVKIDDLSVEPAPDENLLTGEDILGPEPEDCREKCDAWKELEKMAGLDDVKLAISKNFDRAKVNYRREIDGKELLNTSLNRVFLGPPGTGKTTVAKLYGQIIAEIGLVPNREVVFKVPSDFIGRYLGDSEFKTNAIINATKGKVLIIDDAHMFFNGTDETDEFRLACLDVIVSKIHNRPGEGRCIILIGYPDRMEEMFQKCNPGLRRRFPLEEAFRFHDYDDERLREILDLKMEESEIKASTAAMEVASEVLRRARDRPNFGNGGDIVNLLNQAKVRYRERTLRKDTPKGPENCHEARKTKKLNGDKPALSQEAVATCGLAHTNSFELHDLEMASITLEPEDFDPNYNRGSTAAERCRALFDGLIGFEETISLFTGYQRTAENLRRKNKNPRDTIPFTFVFKGPPGTGKTHTARIVGQIFYDMGILSTNEVVECSASQLIGKYVGHTGPKVIDLFEKSLGKVLFVDEAYRLGFSGRNSFGDEAVAEIVDCMTKPRYQRKLVIVLAGYTREIDLLMKVNAGLRGRFTTEINFSPMKPRAALQYLRTLLSKQDIELLEDNDVDTNEYETIIRLLMKLSMTNGWSNGRDVNTLAGMITEHAYNHSEVEEDGKSVFVQRRDLIKLLKDMLRQRIKGGVA
ncbi:uncharacterized protein Triagg1_7552 [Trichoderma aggressivum f. europaeum]|uniref:AAA+ ATPase domain-containing protein n=1 Tax=Trichoderma aggressivum f. europaeum TaxID=173218 RepID=A0AAE1IDN0_9HYPO|nr:hypothetical protein Triagg1_7552 [Trichoderma aggressivum f. europaeum]